MKVRIILTKHCVAWRDFIKEDYETFFTIHNYLLKDKRANFLLQRILHRENLYFHSVDGIIALTNDAYNLLIQCYNIDKNNIRMIYNLNFQLVCSDNLLRLVFLWPSSFSPYLFRLVSRFTPDWDVNPKSLCNLYLLPDKRRYLGGMPLPLDTSYVSHLVKHVKRRGEHAVKACRLPDVSDI